MIRWVSSEIRVLAYLKNLPLLAAFLGLGLGGILAGRRSEAAGASQDGGPRVDRYLLFPPAAFVLAAAIILARPLGLIRVPLPSLPQELWAWTETPYGWAELGRAVPQAARFLAVVVGSGARPRL